MHTKSSNRPYETVQPLAQALGIAVQANFKDDELAELAASLRGQSHGQTLLVCWHHGMMPRLLAALGEPEPTLARRQMAERRVRLAPRLDLRCAGQAEVAAANRRAPA
jgi:broad specificity phosphatase PhoE